jgi:undecaprenyl phosphate N,N'-diacetylbacillosamine 1-phosphate transferase
MYQSLFKPLFDYFLSGIAILILFPVIAFVWILVFFKLGLPVIFTQARPGKNEKIFKLYKFRTMSNKTDGSGFLLPDCDRITQFGLFLRKTSLDELPQLFNVLKGNLSFIGPRPLLVEYLPKYNIEQKKRHLVKPGITGLAQVNGRNSITWEEKFRLDVYYAQNLSLILDIKILCKTIYKIFKMSEVHDNNGNTMDKFTGSGQ